MGVEILLNFRMTDVVIINAQISLFYIRFHLQIISEPFYNTERKKKTSVNKECKCNFWCGLHLSF